MFCPIKPITCQQTHPLVLLSTSSAAVGNELRFSQCYSPLCFTHVYRSESRTLMWWLMTSRASIGRLSLNQWLCKVKCTIHETSMHPITMRHTTTLHYHMYAIFIGVILSSFLTVTLAPIRAYSPGCGTCRSRAGSSTPSRSSMYNLSSPYIYSQTFGAGFREPRWCLCSRCSVSRGWTS